MPPSFTCSCWPSSGLAEIEANDYNLNISRYVAPVVEEEQVDIAEVLARLCEAEPALIDYVVVHELLHLKVRNHGPQFWTEMAAAVPDYNVRRKRLRDIGKTLTL